MMSLREEQSKFAVDILKLLSWALEHGYEFTFGEAFRTAEQQEIYVRTGRSKTMDSKHLKRLAFDIFFFKDGRLLASKEEVQPIGNAWESMCAANSWGGNWKSFKDVPHFERRV
jgi:hypothetical protein